MGETVKLFVNSQEVEVAAGKNLIDALAVAGIQIPHFCYHPALGADGNCRMCLVEIEEGRPPVVPACKTPAMEGMKVVLDSAMIKKVQQDMLEFELINHPVDCPVCDQAGECDLQDYYMAYSLEESRMDVPQVNKKKKLDFGCGVVHDQERCVLCGRCVRFTRQITETGELGIVNRTDAARVDIFPGKPLDNRYALNIVDLCPVGAMTSSDFRFKQRAWFLTRDKGVCHGCAKGCNMYIDHHREKYGDDIIYRYRARTNLQVNGYFICDEGRMSYHLQNNDRQTETIVGGASVSFDNGIKAVVEKLNQAKKPLMIVSPNSTVGQMWAVLRIATLYGGDVSGYSDGYIIEGSGDDYLIHEDKSANRRGLELLAIKQDRAHLLETLGNADLVLNFDNDFHFSAHDIEVAKLLSEKDYVAICSHRLTAFETASVVIPIASYSEYDGVIINHDDVIQRFSRAVHKNNPPKDIVEITRLLGGAITDWKRAWPGIRQTISLLREVEPDQIPEEGMKLMNSGEPDVTA